VREWSYREAAGGIPEPAREPSPVYPAGRVGTSADPSETIASLTAAAPALVVASCRGAGAAAVELSG
jgi:hypothetical protein